MIVDRMPDSSVRLSLKYTGSEVDGGSMPIGEVVSALQGFAGAYGKVANTVAPESLHELRVTAVKQGSFEVHMLGWLTSAHGITALHALEGVGSAASVVFRLIKRYVELKKFLKGDRYEITVGDGNTRLLINRDGESSEVPREVIELLLAKTLDSDLKKIVAPLEAGRVDTAELTATDDKENQEFSIDSSEKSFFGESSGETREEVTLVGRLISNNKETLRGTFERSDGTRFPYRYAGQSPEVFQSVYAYRGSVRVNAIVTIGEGAEIRRIEILDATALQINLDL